MSVSQLYRWCPDPLTDMVAVEEGVNAGALAAAAAAGQADCAGPSTPTHVDCAGPPPVQLTMAEVQQQIEIMAHGMIDRGERPAHSLHGALLAWTSLHWSCVHAKMCGMTACMACMHVCPRRCYGGGVQVPMAQPLWSQRAAGYQVHA